MVVKVPPVQAVDPDATRALTSLPALTIGFQGVVAPVAKSTAPILHRKGAETASAVGLKSVLLFQVGTAAPARSRAASLIRGCPPTWVNEPPA
jgi:hypothetical protein